MAYNFKEIEQRLQAKWDALALYKTNTLSNKKKLYLLVEFPYPSGAGLHVGHVRSYTAMDVVARKRRAEENEVLFPIGWDAFGLPAENYAIKTGIHPSISTKENIDNFRRQLKACGFSFDWEREIDTTDPHFYKWSQWIFLKMYEKGLAYKKKMPVNWCPKDKCVLANEEVVDGKCERCGTEATKKDKEQWMLAITKYAERLHKDLDETTYLDKIKAQQRNWIGLSEGSEINFGIKGDGFDSTFTIFTTRADTLFGCTYCVLAPEHALVEELLAKNIIANKDEVLAYRDEAKNKLDIDRSAEGREKTGVKLEGVLAVNPVNNEEVPLFIADYVLPQYGTGAIMAVPAHDARDYEFAKKYNLEMFNVINYPKVAVGNISEEEEKNFEENPFELMLSKIISQDGELINSGEFTGMNSAEARRSITEKVGGKIVTKSKLRDWVFARQRYWGEPIPVVYDKDGAMYPVSETELPIKLPQVDKYEPTDNGESPLYQVPEWVNVRGHIDETGHFVSDESGEMFRRETDTMPQWAGSSWYFMRYIDPLNNSAIGDKNLLAKWLPVDWYNGGMEHTTLHLLYSRFWYKFLFDIGLVPTSEPYYKRTSQGMILGGGGVKMSKSLGNVVNPDEIIEKYGADVLRVYEMFIGPFDQAVAWDEKGVVGVKRFLDRVEAFKEKVVDEEKELTVLTHQTIKAITDGIEGMSFNTCISSLMIWLNEYEKTGIDKANFQAFIKLLSPFAPFLTEELYKGNKESVHLEGWPVYDVAKLLADEVTISVQFAGKLRGTVSVKRDATQEEVTGAVSKETFYTKNVEGKEITKTIFVPNKIINFVTT